jgi:hypothetical protein
VLHRTLVAFAAVAALGCLPMATIALAAPQGHSGGAHAMAGHAGGGHVARSGGGHVARHGGSRGAQYGGGYGGSIYDSCAGYYSAGYGGCPGYGVPLVGGLVNGVLGGYAR